MTKSKLDYKVIGQELPNEVLYVFSTHHLTKAERYLYAVALNARGWTHSVISRELGVTREAVRQQVLKTNLADAIRFVVDRDLPVPNPPAHDKPAPVVFVEPSAETLARLIELMPIAAKVRSNSPNFRKEAEEFTWLVNYAHVIEGVSLYRLAKRLGCTHGALRFRLARYGYKPATTGTSKAYTPIRTENRVNLT